MSDGGDGGFPKSFYAIAFELKFRGTRRTRRRYDRA